MPNIKKLMAGDQVFAGSRKLNVKLADRIQLFVTATDETGATDEYRPCHLLSSGESHEETRRKRRKKRKKIKREEPIEEEDKDCKDTRDSKDV